MARPSARIQGARRIALSNGMASHRAGKPHNEDRVDLITHDEALVALLADGISSGELGDVMSRLAVDEASKALRTADNAHPRAALERAFITAQQAVIERKRRESLPRSGTTLVCVWLLSIEGELRAHIANIGDSRVYLFREDGTARQLTTDHHDGERLTYALGFPLNPAAVPAFYSEETLRPGETLLLCSDGLYKVLPLRQIAAVLRVGSAQQAAERLVELARRRGTSDNASAIVIGAGAPVRRARSLVVATIAATFCTVGLLLLALAWFGPTGFAPSAPDTLAAPSALPQPALSTTGQTAPSATADAGGGPAPPSPTREPTNPPPTRTPEPTATPSPTRPPLPPTLRPTTLSVPATPAPTELPTVAQPTAEPATALPAIPTLILSTAEPTPTNPAP